jgi:type II secretory pathway pseudopilin PulG
MTLLEMLLVVFILSTIALSTVSFVNNADEQFRYDDTRNRLEKIKTAVIGYPEQTLNRSPAVYGFVADIGRLPGNLQELVEQGTLPGWQYDAASGLWAGWRGPYLSVLPEHTSAVRAFRDGWGNLGSAPNYGWASFTATDIDGATNDLADILLVQSFGSDGTVGGAAYAADYPPTGSERLIERFDHQLNLRGWTVRVTFNNPPGGTDCGTGSFALPCNTATVRIRFYYPQNGAFDWPVSWPPANPDDEPYLSESLLLAAGAVADGATLEQVFNFGTSNDKFVPCGIRSVGVIDDANGSVFASGTQRIITLVPRRQLPEMVSADFIWDLE